MITKVLRRSALVAALVIAPVAGEAQTCGGSQFKTCATVSINTSAVAGGVQVVMQVLNNSGYLGTFASTVFTQIGVFGLPSGWTYGALNVSGPGNWVLGASGLSGSGITPTVAGVDAVNGINGGLAAGSQATFTFTLMGLGLSDVNTAKWALHGQGGPNGCSTKFVVTNGTPNGGSYDAGCGVDPITGIVEVASVPEPATMLLVGTGLAGVGAARRRRKRA